MGDKIRNAPEPILYINVASVLRRQSRDTNRNVKRSEYGSIYNLTFSGTID